MDSLAAPQDRLVEQLLSPRTQAQRRLKVCVERGAEGGSAVRPPPAHGPGMRREPQGRGPGVGAGGRGRLGAAVYK